MSDQAAQLAAQVAAVMERDDKASNSLGIHLESIAPGQAVMVMKVRDDMVNGLAICHGGIVFCLADTAFAFACNSRNIKTLALAGNINFIAAAHSGDVLTACAREVCLAGRTGVYDVRIADQNDKTIAEFRGTAYATSSTVV